VWPVHADRGWPAVFGCHKSLALNGQNISMHGLYDGDFVGYKVASSAELDAALREAVVAVDASVLLDLYRFRPRTSRDLIETLKGLGDRLVVPHQALREFWRRRQRVQDSPAGATKVATDALDKSGRSINDALVTWARAVGADDDEVDDVIASVEVFLDRVKRDLQSVLLEASAEGGGDPILEQLEEILAGRVTSPLSPEEWAECIAEAKHRIESEEPPGYMDADKQDGDLPEGGAGDYLVWYEATRYAKEQDQDLLIVTRDQKQDWWWRQQTDFIGPRPELTLEYHRLTGRRLFLMRPADLLARASVLDVEVDQASTADAGRIGLIEAAAAMPSDDAEPTVGFDDAAASPIEVLEAAIQRLESSGTSPNIRAAVEGLHALGYVLRPAKTIVPGKIPENYLRIIDPEYTAHGIGYLTPSYFAFSRATDRERLLNMPGAEPQTAQVKFSHVESAQPGLEAAELLKS
jgi:PIN like domain